MGEGFPEARRLVQRGYSAFVVGYRTGKEAAYPAVMEDLVEAFHIIGESRNDFALGSGGYLLMGFSAGGHLAANFARYDLGYAHYGLPRQGKILPSKNLSELAASVFLGSTKGRFKPLRH
jgi:hypothetical protein